MTKTKSWQPCLPEQGDEWANEVLPALPLHDPEIGWVQATYLDGTRKALSLPDVFLDAHKIARVELANSVSTVSLYRLLLSISYLHFDFSQSKSSWRDNRLDLLESNEGFRREWVEDYFSTYHDRFYLIHPKLPFLQDPSVAKTYESKPLDFSSDEKGRAEYRKNFSSKLGPIAQIYPMAPSIAKEGGAKTVWGLPPEDVINEEMTPGEKIYILASSLFHQRYNHSSTNRGARTFFDKESGNDTHNILHPFRCAVGYNLEIGSLYQQLLLAMEYVPEEDLEQDVPEWEREINPETGYLAHLGYSVEYTDIYAGPKAPRSSVNLTHMALLLVPEIGEDGTQKPHGGHVKQIRRLLFNFKHLKGKISFPLSWNPYVATKEDGNVLKQTESISASTAMSNPRLFRVPLLPDSGVVKPSILRDFAADDELHEVLGNHPHRVRMFIFAGDASQEKTFADFTIVTNEASSLFSNDVMVNRLESWIESGTRIRNALRSSIKYTASDHKSEHIDLESPIRIFWEEYSSLFFSAFTDSEVASLSDFSEEVREMTERIFDQSTSMFSLTSPLRVSRQRSILRSAVYKELASGHNDDKENNGV